MRGLQSSSPLLPPMDGVYSQQIKLAVVFNIQFTTSYCTGGYLKGLNFMVLKAKTVSWLIFSWHVI